MSAVAAARMTNVLFLKWNGFSRLRVLQTVWRSGPPNVPRTTAEGQLCNNLQTPGSQALKINSAQVGRISRNFDAYNTAKYREIPRNTAKPRETPRTATYLTNSQQVELLEFSCSNV